MADIDAQSKQATLAHMNRDHSLDLGLYLRHVNGLSAAQLAAEGAPQMVDMDLASMRIRTAATGTVHVVPLDPPMAAWSERRQRLIALALEARTAFGVPLPEHGSDSSGGGAPPKPKRTPVPYAPPDVLGLVAMGGVVFYAFLATLVFAGRDETAARTWGRALGALGASPATPSGLASPAGFRALMRHMALPVAAIHVTEVWWLDRTRLVPHGMARLSRDWCLWMGSTLWDGVLGMRRFDRLARQQARDADAGAGAAAGQH